MTLMFDRVTVTRTSDGSLVSLVDYDTSSEASSAFDSLVHGARDTQQRGITIQLRDTFGCRAERKF